MAVRRGRRDAIRHDAGKLRPAPPPFRYHPDPVFTGALAAPDEPCEICGLPRSWRYTGPVYAVEEIETLCPWCIADGSAASHLDATFTDDSAVPSGVSPEAVATVTRRTPGFSGWQQERWLYHCGDAAAFLGRAGWRDLEGLPDALESLRLDSARPGWSPGQIAEYVQSLDDDRSPTAYLFRCLLCHTHLAYSDST
ncbi:MAG: CbrC family protein [Sporichthyaceae bacterium]